LAITKRNALDHGVVWLHALDGSDGSSKWQYGVPREAYGIIADQLSVVAPDGTVYIASVLDTFGQACKTHDQFDDKWNVNTTIHAVDATGTLMWTSTLAGAGTASSVGADGTLFVQHGCFPSVTTTALQPDTGAQLWSVDFPVVCAEARWDPKVVLAEGGNVFVLSSQGEQKCSLSVLSSLSIEDGSLNWQVPLSVSLSGPGTTLKWSSNRVIYVKGLDENQTCSIKAFDLDGNLLRSLPCQCPGCSVYGDEALDSREAEDVFFTLDWGPDGSDTKNVFANSGIDGRVLWNLSLPMDEADSLSLGEDGTLFVWSEYQKARLTAIRQGDVAWQYTATEGSGMISSAVMSKDSTTYIQVFQATADCDNGYVAAVGVAGDVMWTLDMDAPTPTQPVPPAEFQI
jgi:outer membrane protein assembly factor BamB